MKLTTRGAALLGTLALSGSLAVSAQVTPSSATPNLAAPTRTAPVPAPTTAAPDNSVPIGGYTLVSLTQNGQTTSLGSLAPRPTISFDGKRVTGFTGCNTFGGSYVARREVLRFGALAITRKACPDYIDGLEADYLKLLRGVKGFELLGTPGAQTLRLLSGSNDRLVFAQASGTGEVATGGIRSSVDGTWTLKELPAGAAPSADARPIGFTLRGFTISGFDGCNTFSGNANTSSGRLSFAGPVVSTLIACPPGVATLSPLLSAGAAATVQGKTLTLTGEGGVVWMFTRP
ncbi:META domain-containing protein [Deinococcus sp.]|uniref:META domain-containing protein n=1 Tax=Deinococcus sp. TaxID=47478 RepID=UPI0025EC3884|nr:META domain-containing protein [Deinococcus sp.]